MASFVRSYGRELFGSRGGRGLAKMLNRRQPGSALLSSSLSQAPAAPSSSSSTHFRLGLEILPYVQTAGKDFAIPNNGHISVSITNEVSNVVGLPRQLASLPTEVPEDAKEIIHVGSMHVSELAYYESPAVAQVEKHAQNGSLKTIRPSDFVEMVAKLPSSLGKEGPTIQVEKQSLESTLDEATVTIQRENEEAKNEKRKLDGVQKPSSPITQALMMVKKYFKNKAVCYFDMGTHTNAVRSDLLAQGETLNMDSDGALVVRETSIGHVFSHLCWADENPELFIDDKNRDVAVYIAGDGATRLINGCESIFSILADDDRLKKFPHHRIVYIIVDGTWNIEDDLAVGDTLPEHRLKNETFYELLSKHPNAYICSEMGIASTTEQILTNIREESSLNVVFVQADQYKFGAAEQTVGREMELYPIFQNFLQLIQERELNAEAPLPITGCSAFEYIRLLSNFMEEHPGIAKFNCAKSDLMAGHYLGFAKGPASVFLGNTQYGLYGLGEGLRMLSQREDRPKTFLCFFPPDHGQSCYHSHHMHRINVDSLADPNFHHAYIRGLIPKEIPIAHVRLTPQDKSQTVIPGEEMEPLTTTIPDDADFVIVDFAYN